MVEWWAGQRVGQKARWMVDQMAENWVVKSVPLTAVLKAAKWVAQLENLMVDLMAML